MMEHYKKLVVQLFIFYVDGFFNIEIECKTVNLRSYGVGYELCGESSIGTVDLPFVK